MNITVHPVAASKTVFSMVCDNYIIGKDGVEHLHKYPKEILVCG